MAGSAAACFDPSDAPDGGGSSDTEDAGSSSTSDAETMTPTSESTDATSSSPTDASTGSSTSVDPSTGPMGCDGELCCPAGEPLDGVSCGVGCTCGDGEAIETVCTDRSDNDEDAQRDCADVDCVGEVCRESSMLSIVATADTWVQSSLPDNNNNVAVTTGQENTRVEFGGTPSGSEYEAYFAFADVVPMDGIEVVSATLEVYVYASDDDSDDVVHTGSYEIVAAWDESTLTWTSSHTGSNQDLLGSEPSDAILVGDTDPNDGVTEVHPEMAWYQYDVTPIVAGWIDGSHENFGIAIAPLRDQPVNEASEDILYAYTKAAPDLRPQLTIEYRSRCTIEMACAALE